MMAFPEVYAKLHQQAKEWAGLPYSRLMVRAWLLSPVAHDVIGHMPLDGLLSVAVLAHLGISIDELDSMEPEPAFIPIPVRKVEIDGTWIYACSWCRYHPSTVQIVRAKRKHFHESRFIIPKLIDTSSGKFRSYDLKCAAVVTPYVEWTIEASREMLIMLLPHLSSIGKDRNTGLGTVSAWEIDSTDRDPLVHEGVPQRAIPCPDGDLTAYTPGSCALGLRSIRPPYVWQGTRMQCAVPAGPS